jgi:hypothetical protein
MWKRKIEKSEEKRGRIQFGINKRKKKSINHFPSLLNVTNKSSWSSSRVEVSVWVDNNILEKMANAPKKIML